MLQDEGGLPTRGSRTRVPRLGLLRLRPDPVHGSPSREPLVDRIAFDPPLRCTSWIARSQRDVPAPRTAPVSNLARRGSPSMLGAGLLPCSARVSIRARRRSPSVLGAGLLPCSARVSDPAETADRRSPIPRRKLPAETHHLQLPPQQPRSGIVGKSAGTTLPLGFATASPSSRSPGLMCEEFPSRPAVEPRRPAVFPPLREKA